MRKFALVLGLIVLASRLFVGPAPADAACTGSSPNLSAPDTGNVTQNGTDLQLCINAAVFGDTIALTPGAEYRGNFTLPNKGAGSSFITIQLTSGGMTNFPSGTRVTAGQASLMAKLTTANSNPVLTLLPDAHHYQFIALNVTSTGDPWNAGQSIPRLVAPDDTVTYNHWPANLVFDRVLVHPFETDPLPSRAATIGISIDGATITVKNSAIYDFMGWDPPQVAQNITAITAASPAKITTAGANSDPGHKILLFIQGATGNWTGVNGTKVATFVDANNYTLENYDPTTFALSNVNTIGATGGIGAPSLGSTSISANHAISFGNGPGPYTLTNNLLEAYYSPLFSGGNNGTWIDPNHVVTVNAVNSISQVVLSGVTDLQVGDLIAFSTTQDQAITGVTTGNPTRLTVQTHRFPAGTSLYPEGCIIISGFTGIQWSTLNRGWGGFGNGGGFCTGSAVTVDANHIDISVDTTGFPAVTGTPIWKALVKDNSGFTQWHVGKVTNIAGTTVDFSWWGHQPQNTGGNGAGILIAPGATAQWRGRVISGITMTNNTFQNRASWIKLIANVANTCGNCSGQPPKANPGEFKMADNVTMIGNIVQMLGGPLDPHSGYVGLALNQANQIGATPWVSLNNWTVQSNLWKNYAYMKISTAEEYETGVASTGFLLDNNLFTHDLTSFLNLEGTDGVTVTHNTVRNVGTGGENSGGANTFFFVFNTNTNSIVRNNLGLWSAHGYNDNGTGWAPTRDHNYLIDNLSIGDPPPAGDTRIANDAAMGFVDVVSADAGGDYHGYKLTAGSPGHNAASDGTDVGVNFTTLDAALGGSGGTPPSAPTGLHFIP